MGHFGVIAPILSTVLSVFMLGLGLGAWAIGRWLSSPRGARLSPGALLALYGCWEGLAAAGSLAVPFLFSAFDAHVSSGMGTGTYFASSAAVVFGALFVPCVALGATTPTALAYGRARGWDATYRFSWLYLANLLGALAGATLTPFVLIEWWGFHRTLLFGIFLQALISGCALAARPEKILRPARAPEISERVHPLPSQKIVCVALAALFITGFVSMGCEVVWTRLFTRVLGTTIYAFAGILAVYLAMNAVGVGAYRRWGRSAAPSINGVDDGQFAFRSLLPLFINQPSFTKRLCAFSAVLRCFAPSWDG